MALKREVRPHLCRPNPCRAGDSRRRSRTRTALADPAAIVRRALERASAAESDESARLLAVDARDGWCRLVRPELGDSVAEKGAGAENPENAPR